MALYAKELQGDAGNVNIAGDWVDRLQASGRYSFLRQEATCAPNDFMRPIHHRMPTILRDIDYAAWLDPQAPANVLQSLISTRNSDGVHAVPIQKLTPDS